MNPRPPRHSHPSDLTISRLADRIIAHGRPTSSSRATEGAEFVKVLDFGDYQHLGRAARRMVPSTLPWDRRASLSIHELCGLFEVAEPDAIFLHEAHRWSWILHDYTHSLEPQLHERLEALAPRFETVEPKGVREAWETLLDCRQLDACLGLLLARLTMLDPNARPSLVQGYVDPMATRAAGSFAWWCRWTLDAWHDEYPLGDRLRPEEIPRFVGFALHKLHELDAGLLEALLRVFPIEP